MHVHLVLVSGFGHWRSLVISSRLTELTQHACMLYVHDAKNRPERMVLGWGTKSTAAYPQDFFFWLRPRISSPWRRVRTTGNSERLTNGAPTSYERLRKVPLLLEDFPHPQNLIAGKVCLVGIAAIMAIGIKSWTLLCFDPLLYLMSFHACKTFVWYNLIHLIKTWIKTEVHTEPWLLCIITPVQNTGVFMKTTFFFNEYLWIYEY